VTLAFVVQRYGATIAGGSEAHCRHLAERLAGRHDITVLTTCATDYVTWRNALPPGPSVERGVRVIRFPVSRPRDLKAFADISDEVFDGLGATPDREEAWFEANGPDAPGLIEHLRDHGHEYDLVLFWTYRYATTYFGLPLVADRAVLLPTAEEDPAIDLRVLPGFFARPAGFIFLTPEEDALVSTRAGRALHPSTTIGSGLDPATAPPPDRSTLDALGLPARFVLYLGRIDRNKGCEMLLEYYRAYLDEGGDTPLVLAGPSTLIIPDDPRIRALGYVSDAVREALLTHAALLVVPSPYESLSMVLLEAWNHGTPALVNAQCRVLDGQVRRANGGLSFRSSREFQEALSWLLAHEAARRELGHQGLAYVEREYRWPTVLTRVEALLAEVSARRAAAR
jgi:glycosyltransferase involved in cell wall biosynthesis